MADVLKNLSDKARSLAVLLGSIATIISLLSGAAYWFFYSSSEGEKLEVELALALVRIDALEKGDIEDEVVALSKQRKAACDSDNTALAENLQLQIERLRGEVPTGADGCNN